MVRLLLDGCPYWEFSTLASSMETFGSLFGPELLGFFKTGSVEAGRSLILPLAKLTSLGS